MMTSLKRLMVLAICGMISLPVLSKGVIYDGDGSDEAGFVPLPQKRKAPPPPPANISSGESYIPYPGPPVTPMRRSEKKKPPSPPVMFVKLTSNYGGMDWNSRPNDLNHLLKAMKKLADVDFQCEVRSFKDVNANPDRNPILYRSGHFHFSFDKDEKKKLREFLLNGGMVIFNAGLGSKPFYDSARQVMAEVLPESPVQRLSPDHPVFHSYYDLDRAAYLPAVRKAGYQGDEPWLEGVTVNCRTVAIISRWGMDAGWDPDAEDGDAQAYEPEAARKLGLNLVSYATAMRAWSKNATGAMQFVDAPEASAGGKMAITQVIYRGEWKTRHSGLSVLLQQFNKRTEIPVKFARNEVKLTDPKLFGAPVIYMTGHEDFTLDVDEIAALRRYLKNGGMVIAEACCGREGFDRAFREAMGKVLPGTPLQQIAPDSLIFSIPNQIADLTVTPALAAQNENKPALPPKLFGIELDGHQAVIYSPYGMAGGWELSQSPYAIGYADDAALKLGENILMFAITK